MKKKKLPRRNYLVILVIKKTGAGQHKNKKREQKSKHQE
jgi:hypothetical protein